MFICGGSFEGIEKIILKRLHQGHSGMGFGANLSKVDEKKDNIFLQAKIEDFKKFGMIPEILGRLPVICPLEELTIEQLKQILTVPKNALVKQYNELLKMEGSSLTVTDIALTKIAQLAIERKTGARALRSIIEETLGTTMFDLPEHPEDKEIIIDTEDNNLIIRRQSYGNLTKRMPHNPFAK